MIVDHLRDAIRDTKPVGREHIELHPSKMMVPLVRSAVAQARTLETNHTI